MTKSSDNMKAMLRSWVLFNVLLVLEVKAHGYMAQPAARNALWKFGYQNPPNYNLMSLNAGGPSEVQRKGHSVCGDHVGGPFDHMDGGKYANGIIAQTYKESDTIDISLVITAHHKGWVYFNLCDLAEGSTTQTQVTQECLDVHPLVRSDGGGIESPLPDPNPDGGASQYSFRYVLPAGVTCSRCVLQWYWKTGNSPGAYPEEFWNCADIKIEPSNALPHSSTSTIISISPTYTTSTGIQPTTVTTATSSVVTPIITNTGNPIVLGYTGMYKENYAHKDTAKVVGYYTNWAQYRTGKAKFEPENIDARMYTHLCYAFAMINEDLSIKTFEWNDVQMYQRFHTHVRSQNPNIKTLISIGGWTFSTDPATKHIFPLAASSDVYRRLLCRNLINFSRQHGFDGIDLDWEYPEVSHRNDFTELLKVCQEEISNEASQNGMVPLQLSIAVAASHTTTPVIYDINEIHKYLDFINLMSYDLHGSWENFSRPHTLLNAVNEEDPNSYSILRSVDAWLQHGTPGKKLILGMATYGRAQTLAGTPNPNIPNIDHPTVHPALRGDYTQAEGFLSYYEIEDLIVQGATKIYDDVTMTTVVQKDNIWVAYDDKVTLGMKVDFLESRNLGGAMFWAIDLDDFNNNYPLIGYVANIVIGNGDGVTVPDVTAPPPSSSASSSTATTSTQTQPSNPTAATSSGSSRCVSMVDYVTDEFCHSTGCIDSNVGVYCRIDENIIPPGVPTEDIPNITPPTTTAIDPQPTISGSVRCVSMVDYISNEWCHSTGCADDYVGIYCRIDASVAPTQDATPTTTETTPISSSGRCVSMVDYISDEWCHSTNCVEDYLGIYCRRDESDIPKVVPNEDEPKCLSLVPHISNEWCQSTNCHSAYANYCAFA
eukprot:Awhi_evm1s13415